MSKISKFKVNVGKKAKIVIDWRDNPENYSYEAKKQIKSIVSNRYGIPKESVSVDFTPVKYNEKGEMINASTEVISNIQDPKFQIKLFNDYVNENNIVGVDFEFIKKIDSGINSKIDYDIYEKYRKYDIEWIEWDNFLSYGSNNRFDFRSLNGLTLVNGTPANMSGKSSFTIDLISFLLFGKPQKPYTIGECFNKFTNQKTFSVRGGLKIDGNDYIIERVVTRTLSKSTGEWGEGKQKVKYYQIVNGQEEDLPDKNESGEYSSKTNQIIKEAIGNEKDFNMIISATGDDLDALISIGNTERGRLLSKWIGLFPLEEKDKIAKEAYKEFEKPLKSKIYNETDLQNEIDKNIELIKQNELNLNIVTNRNNELNSLITQTQEEKDVLLSSKRKIDDSILKLDIDTVNRKIEKIKNDGKLKNTELETNTKEYELIKDINFNIDEYKNCLEIDKNLSIEMNQLKNEISLLRTTNKNLLESEFCPTCHRKYEGADNSAIIKENEDKINKLINNGIDIKSKFDENKKTISKMDSDKPSYDRKLKLENLIQILPIQIENLRNEYREQSQLLKDYDNNKEAIDVNNQIDIQLTNFNAKINSYNIEKNSKIKEIENIKRDNFELNKVIDKNTILINEIKEELIKIKNWKIYLEMVGKNGISKMVLRKTLPIINSELSRMLDDVCDFEIEVSLTEKNEVNFKIIKDGVASNLAGASGFEKTASALALRCVLGNISTMPKPNFITMDEILGKVARENYDNMRNIYAKIENNYQFILHISHIEEIKDWHKNIITISKDSSNVSSIKSTINNKNN